MSVNAVFCRTCKSRIEPIKGASVVLSNKRRAFKAMCPKCETESYKVIPDKRGTHETQLTLLTSENRLMRKPSGLKGQQFPDLKSKAYADYMPLQKGDMVLHFGIGLIMLGLSILVACALHFRTL